jgi:phenylpyruvate tautomerase PptA (4-oxalocrotonate tautomerase family)
MLDAYIPEGALEAGAEKALLSKLTDVLLEHEGTDPTNPAARALAKVWLHRPAAVMHAGEEPGMPHYRLIASVPQGQFDDERRSGMVAAVTDAVLDAEGGRYDRDPLRVWVFASEIPDGTWGGGGRIVRLAEIAGFVLGDAEKGRAYATQRLAGREADAVIPTH